MRLGAVSSEGARTDCPALAGLRGLDERMQQQLARAVALSESASMQTIQRVTGLRGLSSRLMLYLEGAHTQSRQIQQEFERHGSIIEELTGFVQQLPRQIAHERQDLEQLIGEVKALSGITETIKLMARQTEILSINAAIAAAHAGEAGRGFSVLAGEVRRLATESNQSAQDIEAHIRRLVDRVQARSQGEFADRMQHNEREAERLLALTGKLDEGYLDMRQFYAMMLTAVTEHNTALDRDITALLDVTQGQDVFKQIIDRLRPAFASRDEVVSQLIATLRRSRIDSQGREQLAALESRASALSTDYELAEHAHSDPESQPHQPLTRIELF